MALVSAAQAITLHLYGLVREADACWERDGRLYFLTRGQTYNVPRADVQRIEGNSSAPTATAQEAPVSQAEDPARLAAPPKDLPLLLAAAKGGRLAEIRMLLGQGWPRTRLGRVGRQSCIGPRRMVTDP